MNNGIDKVLIHLTTYIWKDWKDIYWIQSLKENPTLIDYNFSKTEIEDKSLLDMIQLFYTLMKWYCNKKKIMDRYQSFINSMTAKYTRLSNFNSRYGRLFFGKMSILHEYQTEAHIKVAVSPQQKADKRCGWNKCKIERIYCHRHIEWKICKGCKFVFYCCRKHQKRHWNVAHSSQCKKLSYLRRKEK